ncbi:glycosyltransferase [Aliiroseovarius subalbicans]|uniref:glycosyltransferase n=1 Tax=Aliiroseovarius subalbicans TaxID=2925840 RepID=UPI001F5A51C2|nr:glycosyltransferase [Aliiroseovarius subalbicans]MCI2399802.1 glycosyltransferase [Aliiroseovarius subalbicans]
MTIHPALAPFLAIKPTARLHLRILMGTHNGASTLAAQLNSFAAQEHENWSLWASDDQSTDRTVDELRRFAQAHPGRDIRILNGPGAGLAANYLSLLCHPDLPPGPVALSDQDDVWLPGRLTRALAAIEAAEAKASAGTPVLYASRTILTDQILARKRRSARLRRPPEFANALVQNVMYGNTLVLNRAALDLVRRAGVQTGLSFHDWWLYLLISGAGGILIHDQTPGVLYRQHGKNALGGHRGVVTGLTRLHSLLRGGYGDWISRNLAALNAQRALLTPESRARLDALARCQANSPMQRLIALCNAGAYRQTRLQSALIYLAVLLRRL